LVTSNWKQQEKRVPENYFVLFRMKTALQYWLSGFTIVFTGQVIE
jgi:hypothetical protein